MENHTTLFSWSSWLVAWSTTMTTMKNDVKYNEIIHICTVVVDECEE